LASSDKRHTTDQTGPWVTQPDQPLWAVRAMAANPHTYAMRKRSNELTYTEVGVSAQSRDDLDSSATLSA